MTNADALPENSDQTPSSLKLWAVCGRLLGDDDDIVELIWAADQKALAVEFDNRIRDSNDITRAADWASESGVDNTKIFVTSQELVGKIVDRVFVLASAIADQLPANALTVNPSTTLAPFSAEMPSTSALPSTYNSVHQPLADLFLTDLKVAIGDEAFAEMCIKNRDREHPHVCHSHDYIDANVVMADAYEKLIGKTVEVQDNEQRQIWSAAWAIATKVSSEMAGQAPGPAPASDVSNCAYE